MAPSPLLAVSPVVISYGIDGQYPSEIRPVGCRTPAGHLRRPATRMLRSSTPGLLDRPERHLRETPRGETASGATGVTGNASGGTVRYGGTKPGLGLTLPTLRWRSQRPSDPRRNAAA